MSTDTTKPYRYLEILEAWEARYLALKREFVFLEQQEERLMALRDKLVELGFEDFGLSCDAGSAYLNARGPNSMTLMESQAIVIPAIHSFFPNLDRRLVDFVDNDNTYRTLRYAIKRGDTDFTIGVRTYLGAENQKCKLIEVDRTYKATVAVCSDDFAPATAA